MRYLFLLLGVLVLAGCATTQEEKNPNEVKREEVSTIPWNRPQRWEGQGQLGGLGGR